MTQPIMTDAQTRRRELFAAINAGIDFGLPTPTDIQLDTEHIYFDSAADLCGWADWFGYTPTIPATHGQPHPDLADMLHLGARDPITDEQRQHWIDSGQAATFAEPEPEPAPVDEPHIHRDRYGDPIPAHELCVASLHIPAADEACGWCGAVGFRSAQHVEVMGTASSDGECSAGCACGVTVSGFDSLREASAALAEHIAAATEPTSEAR